METINISIFKDSSAFSMSMSYWGARREVDPKAFKDRIPPEVLKKALKVNKILVVHDVYDDVRSYMSKLRTNIKARYVVPSFFKKGIDIVRMSAVSELEAQLNAAKIELPKKVKALGAVMPEIKKEAEERLRDTAERILGVQGITFYDEREYPTPDELQSLFEIKWNFIALGVPDLLPKEIFEAEKARVEKVWQEAEAQITGFLRQSWQSLIDHFIDRLTVDPGDKKKVFRDSMVSNMNEFCDAFKNRNITGDEELGKLVDQAKKLMKNLSAEELRADAGTREALLASFTKLKEQADKLVETLPNRLFTFEGDAQE